MNAPLYAANQVQQMAEKSTNSKMAFALTSLSIALVAAMTINQFKELFRSNDRTHNFDRDECSRHQR